jgi:hypothetical protein
MARYHEGPVLRERAPVFADRAALGQHRSSMLREFRGSRGLHQARQSGLLSAKGVRNSIN